MFKYLVKVMLFSTVPFAFAADTLPVPANSIIDALLLNSVTIDRNEGIAVVFDPQELNGEALPDYCLLTAQVGFDGQVVSVNAQNLLCITEAQKVIEGAVSGAARMVNQAAVSFACARTSGDGCQRAVLAEGSMLRFTADVDALLQPQR